MLVILVIGITTAFVTSLSQTAITNKRNQATAEALARAKEALIGRALSDANLPGSLPCPDISTNNPPSNVPNDGVADLLSGNDCPNYLGRLPWKTLGITDLRDGTGERLWYVISPNFKGQTSTPHSLNSDTLGTLSVSGEVSATDIIAIIFAPGRSLSNQVRSATNVNTYAHYLESVITSPGAFNKLTPNDTGNGGYTYNDQMIFITYNDLMPLIERRIARELKACLDEYALSNPSENYPWPAQVSSAAYTSYRPTSPSDYILFGRIPDLPNVYTTNSIALQFMDKLNMLEAALVNYESASPVTTPIREALDAAGVAMEDYADGWTLGWPITFGTADNAEKAGDLAQDLAQDLAETPPTSTVSAVRNRISNALTGMVNSYHISPASISPYTMPTYWPNCTLLAQPSSPDSYWSYWKKLFFYRIANVCRPYWGTCDSTAADLSLTGSGHTQPGSGTYRALVFMGRRALTGQTHTGSTSVSNFLESNNVQDEMDTTPNSFRTYKISDPLYSNLNDLVLCMDGNINCQ